MKVPAQQLENHLNSTTAKNVFLVCGDEPLLLEEACQQLRQFAASNEYDERIVFSVEKGFSWSDLIAATANQGLFSQKQLVELRLPGGKVGKEGSEFLTNFIPDLSSDTLLIIITGKLEPAISRSRWYKTIDKVGAIVQVWPIDQQQLPQWIANRLQASGLQAEADAIALLAERTTGNLLAAAQTIEKLQLLNPQGPICLQVMNDCVADHARFNVFKLVDAVLAGNAKTSQRIMHSLQQEAAEPVLVLWALSKECQRLVQISHLIHREESLERLLTQHGVWDKQKPLYRSALARHSFTRWLELLHHCAEMDLLCKGFAPGNVWSRLQHFCFEMAQSKTTTAD